MNSTHENQISYHIIKSHCSSANDYSVLDIHYMLGYDDELKAKLYSSFYCSLVDYLNKAYQMQRLFNFELNVTLMNCYVQWGREEACVGYFEI